MNISNICNNTCDPSGIFTYPAWSNPILVVLVVVAFSVILLGVIKLLSWVITPHNDLDI